jgi:subtilisin family serine protease
MRLSSAAIILLLSLSSLSSASAKPLGRGDGKKKGKDKTKEKDKKTKPISSLDDDVELAVRYKNDKGRDDLKLEANDGKVEKDIKRFKVATLKTKRSKINKIAKDPNIEAVSVSQTYHTLPHMRGRQAQDERNLVEETIPYGIGLVQADQLAQGPNSVTVCIIDTGYGLGHPDLPNITHDINGYSPYGTDERWDVDVDSHGTHCAGTIGAIGSNDIGVTSVNPDPFKFTFFIGKGLKNSGSGTTAGVIAAVDACVENGAKVISMSLGCEGCYSSVEEAAMKDAYDAGVLIIAAAGNGGDGALKSYPASYGTVMSVGAVDINENIASFSQHNSQVEISGPGVDIFSTTTKNDGSGFSYDTYSGTSMATPHVAGVAALVWSHFPDCSNNQIRNVLIKTSVHPDSTGCDEYYGYGIVQAKAAYDLLNSTGCTAGGVNPGGALSNAATGGCGQDPDYVPPPTAAPTPFVCDETTVSIQLHTDQYGYETSWELKNSAGDVQFSGSGYSADTDYLENACVSTDTCTLVISDSFGDGICCGYGSGSFSVTRNGVTLNGNPIFARTETIDICEGTGNISTASPTGTPVSPTGTPASPTGTPASPTSSPTDTPTKTPTSSPTTTPTSSPTKAPTETPTSSPTTTPTSSPTKAPTLAPVASPPPVKTDCLETESDFEFSILTDNWPEETQWNIVDWLSNTTVGAGGPYLLKDTIFTEEMCIPKSCYVFTITDSYGDGHCCGHGEGSHYLSVDGVSVITNGGDFGSSAYTLFGNCLP